MHGTRRNDTVTAWWTGGVGDTTRSAEQVEAEHACAKRYLATDGREMHWVMIRNILASVADTAIAPVQDQLGLGSEARMNLPARASGNWRWRLEPGQLTPALEKRLGELTQIYGRSSRAARGEEPPR